MRFAIATTDRYLGVFEALVFAGWKPVRLFTTPAKDELDNQQAVIAYAEQLGIPSQQTRMTENDMRDLQTQGCETLVVAGYDWRIGDWQPFLKYTVNFHCSPLPEGRGPYPAIRAILDKWDYWAVTCHRLTPEIDKGDILAAEKFPLQPDECHESLDLKIQIAAKKLAFNIAGRFPALWERATPQQGGNYWKKFRIEERIIDFGKPVEDILRHIRAFGTNESLAHVNGTWLLVSRAIGWTEFQNQATGSIAHTYNRSVVVTALDGYIGLLEWNPASAELAEEIQDALAGGTRTA